MTVQIANSPHSVMTRVSRPGEPGVVQVHQWGELIGEAREVNGAWIPIPSHVVAGQTVRARASLFDAVQALEQAFFNWELDQALSNGDNPWGEVDPAETCWDVL